MAITALSFTSSSNHRNLKSPTSTTIVGDFCRTTIFHHYHRYGQLSGMVEPIAGLLGAFLVVLATPILPYALSFAAGAMIFVVVDDIIPEAHCRYL